MKLENKQLPSWYVLSAAFIKICTCNITSERVNIAARPPLLNLEVEIFPVSLLVMLTVFTTFEAVSTEQTDFIAESDVDSFR